MLPPYPHSLFFQSSKFLPICNGHSVKNIAIGHSFGGRTKEINVAESFLRGNWPPFQSMGSGNWVSLGTKQEMKTLYWISSVHLPVLSCLLGFCFVLFCFLFCFVCCLIIDEKQHSFWPLFYSAPKDAVFY